MAVKTKSKGVRIEATMVEIIMEKVGPHAVTVWRFLNNQEVGGEFGPNGRITHDAASIVEATGLDESAVFGAVIALVRNGWAKMTKDGSKVRAA